MRRYAALAVAALCVVAVLALATGSAVASRSVSVSETRVTVTSTTLTFHGTEGPEVSIICDVTASGTMPRSIAKTVGTRIGTTTDIRISNCRSNLGAVTAVVLGLPWNGTYVSFTGTLPEISAISARQTVAFQFRIGAIECLYEGSGVSQIEASRGLISRGRVNTEQTRLPLIRGGFLCPARGTFEGSGAVTPNIRVTLV